MRDHRGGTYHPYGQARHYISRTVADASDREILWHYISMGSFGVICIWAPDGFDEPAESIAEKINAMCMALTNGMASERRRT